MRVFPFPRLYRLAILMIRKDEPSYKGWSTKAKGFIPRRSAQKRHVPKPNISMGENDKLFRPTLRFRTFLEILGARHYS